MRFITKRCHSFVFPSFAFFVALCCVVLCRVLLTGTAKVMIAEKYLKKFFRFILYPALKMTGGKSRKKKICGSKIREGMLSRLKRRINPPKRMPMKMETTDSGIQYHLRLKRWKDAKERRQLRDE